MASEEENSNLNKIISAILNDGKEDTLRELCSNKDDVNLGYKTESGEITPLALAAKLGKSNLAKMLLENAADVNSKDERGRTALYLACKNNDTSLVKLLLNKGADPNFKQRNKTPLLYAIKQKNQQNVQALLSAGANATEIVSSSNIVCSYVHVATTHVKGPDLDIIRSLVESGCSVNMSDYCGEIPLEFAVRENDLTLTNTLLELGANPNIPLQLGGSVLHQAAGKVYSHSSVQPHSAMVIALVEHGAQVNVTDSQGRTPLALNLSFYPLGLVGGKLDTARYLIQNGTILNEPVLSTTMGINLFQSGAFELMELFIRCGFNAHSVPWLKKYVELTEIAEQEHLTHRHDMDKLKKFISYLHSYFKEPLPLSRVCCFMIRNCVISATDGIYVQKQIQRLPLPEPLIDLLSLNEL